MSQPVLAVPVGTFTALRERNAGTDISYVGPRGPRHASSILPCFADLEYHSFSTHFQNPKNKVCQHQINNILPDNTNVVMQILSMGSDISHFQLLRREVAIQLYVKGNASTVCYEKNRDRSRGGALCCRCPHWSNCYYLLCAPVPAALLYSRQLTIPQASLQVQICQDFLMISICER